MHLSVSPDVAQNQDTDHKTDENGQSPQAGNGDLVHPAGILGHIHRPYFICEGFYHRGHKEADDQRRQQGEGHVGDQLVV